MQSSIRVIQVGLGPVGQILTPFLLERSYLKLVGACDIDPAKTGKDLGEVSNLGRSLKVPLRENLDGFAPDSADVAIVTTSSKLSDLLPTLETAAKLGFDVVSTCEELVYPWVRQSEIAKKIDRMAKEADVSIFATGVNPGFLMDALVVTATGICRNVERIRVERIQDASKRRLPFQQKIGAGLTAGEFRARVSNGKLGHVGLTESMHMIAARLGWTLSRTEDKIEPVLCPKEKEKVIGLTQQGRGWVGNDEKITLEFRAALNEPNPRDSIQIQGTPTFNMEVPGGIHGDIATCAMITNAISVITQAQPGLRTMADVPPISFRM